MKCGASLKKAIHLDLDTSKKLRKDKYLLNILLVPGGGHRGACLEIIMHYNLQGEVIMTYVHHKLEQISTCWGNGSTL